jgi:hypothetical protein
MSVKTHWYWRCGADVRLIVMTNSKRYRLMPPRCSMFSSMVGSVFKDARPKDAGAHSVLNVFTLVATQQRTFTREAQQR